LDYNWLLAGDGVALQAVIKMPAFHGRAWRREMIAPSDCHWDSHAGRRVWCLEMFYLRFQAQQCWSYGRFSGRL